MSEIHETIEKAHEGEHPQYFNRRIALLIAVLALFLSVSETLGKSAQPEAISANVKSADTWAFSHPHDIRSNVLTAADDQMLLLTASVTDPTTKQAIDKQVETWRKNAARYESDPQTGEGLKELRVRAKQEEEERDLALAKYHHYELASAAYQVGIVLASA